MPVDIFKYRNWVLETEKEQTKALYNKVPMGGAQDCGCGTCRDFILLRDKIYPDEMKSLFEKLGVDINKEVEVCDFGDTETGYIFSWWFHFVREIIDGDDCNVPIETNGFTIDLTPIDDIFSIGFTRKISLTLVEKQQGLIQIELMTKVPNISVAKN